MARPRTPVGTFGAITVQPAGNGTVMARTRYRDEDGRLRLVQASRGRERRVAASNLPDPRVERTRTVACRAALDELAETGYGQFTIESVAVRSGVAKSTIYRHWKDKVALIADAFETSHERMVPQDEEGTAWERIEVLVRHVAEVLLDSTFSRCIPALIEGAAHDGRLRKFHRRYAAERRGALTGVIEEGKASGEIVPGVDADLAAQALLGVLFYRRLMTGEPFLPGDAHKLVELVLTSATSTRKAHKR